MIAWLLPAALAGLVAAFGPLLVHLLRRRQSRRTVVPTVRFVPAVSQSSLRLRAPDDRLLLLLRTGAIVAAVIALASPIFLTAARQRAWDARTMRAVVVDTSPSAAAERSAEIIAGELGGGSLSKRIDTSRIGDGLRRATAWLAAAPPGRREVVIVSDFQHGSVSAAEITAVPAAVGLRFVRAAGTALSNRIDDGHELFDGRSVNRWVMLDGWKTAMTVSAEGNTSPRLQIEGASVDEAGRLERILRAGGITWPRTTGTTIVRFGAAEAAPVQVHATGAAARPALRLLQDAAVAGIPFSASADGDTLSVATSVAPSSYEAAALVQAAVASWRDAAGHAEADVQTLPDDMLRAWTRPPGPADPSGWQLAERGDARWFWIASLLCLTAEWWVRRRPAESEARHVRAA
jgi:hypothetical protein